jgi:predicted ester cyclase
MDKNELRRLTKNWNDAWNSGDPSALEAFFLPGATYYDPTFLNGPEAGRPGIRRAALKTWEDWPGARFEVVSMVVDSPHVALEWRSTATHRSGASLRLEGIDLLEWEAEKLKNARTYFDVSIRKAFER